MQTNTTISNAIKSVLGWQEGQHKNPPSLPKRMPICEKHDSCHLKRDVTTGIPALIPARIGTFQITRAPKDGRRQGSKIKHSGPSHKMARSEDAKTAPPKMQFSLRASPRAAIHQKHLSVAMETPPVAMVTASSSSGVGFSGGLPLSEDYRKWGSGVMRGGGG